MNETTSLLASRFPVVGVRPNYNFRSVTDFGAVGDGVNDDTAAFRAAAARGEPILVPRPSAFYRITNTINLSSGTVFQGDGSSPTIKLVGSTTSRLIDAQGKTGCGLRALTLDGSLITTTGTVIRFRDCVRPFMEDVRVLNMPASTSGTLSISGTTERAVIRRCDFDTTGATAIYLTGTSKEARIEDNEIRNTGFFGIFGDSFTNRNLVRGNYCHTTGIEGIAFTWGCRFNRITENHCELSGDNGISCSGTHNVVSNNICLNNDRAGIGVWGSFNYIGGNVSINNDQEMTGDWAGVWVANGYGGTGQNNTIIANITDDDQASPTQKYGVRLKANVYQSWAAGVAVSAGEYRVSGLHIYKADAAGTTGATAPTHTTGSVSDGAVSWTYINSHRSAVTVRTNMVIFNTPGRNLSGGAPNSDASGWVNNQVFGYAGDVRVNWPTSTSGLQSGQVWKDTAAGNALKVV